MNYNKDKFGSFIQNKGIKRKHIADILNVTYPTFLSKFNGKSKWNLDDFRKLQSIMTEKEMNDIFFND